MSTVKITYDRRNGGPQHTDILRLPDAPTRDIALMEAGATFFGIHQTARILAVEITGDIGGDTEARAAVIADYLRQMAARFNEIDPDSWDGADVTAFLCEQMELYGVSTSTTV